MLQLAEERNLSLRYPQSWSVDWNVCIGNLEKEVSESDIRCGAYRDVLVGH